MHGEVRIATSPQRVRRRRQVGHSWKPPRRPGTRTQTRNHRAPLWGGQPRTRSVFRRIPLLEVPTPAPSRPLVAAFVHDGGSDGGGGAGAQHVLQPVPLPVRLRQLQQRAVHQPARADNPGAGEAGGLLRTTSRTHNGARRTFRVDAHTDARTRFVVARPWYEHAPSARFRVFFHSTSVESLFVVLKDPPARRVGVENAALGTFLGLGGVSGGAFAVPIGLLLDRVDPHWAGASTRPLLRST